MSILSTADEALAPKPVLELTSETLAMARIEGIEIGDTVELCCIATAVDVAEYMDDNGMPASTVAFELTRIQLEPSDGRQDDQEQFSPAPRQAPRKMSMLLPQQPARPQHYMNGLR